MRQPDTRRRPECTGAKSRCWRTGTRFDRLTMRRVPAAGGSTNMITITESASEKVKELLSSEEREGHALRVFVRGMSCSGPAYGMALDDSTRPDDTIAEVFGVKIVVDPASAQYVEGAEIDY